jgi:hypothetical protein
MTYLLVQRCIKNQKGRSPNIILGESYKLKLYGRLESRVINCQDVSANDGHFYG